MKHLSRVFFILPTFGLLEFTVVLHSGKGGNWALPTYLAFTAVMLTVGLVLALRAQRMQGRGLPGPAGD
jgi:hypothetical protein